MNDIHGQEGHGELSDKDLKHLLEDFVVGNPDLARLEAELAAGILGLLAAGGVVTVISAYNPDMSASI